MARGPDVDRDGQAELGAGGVDGVVELVVERVLVHERRHPHERDRGVRGEGAQACALAHRAVGAVDDERDAAGGRDARPPHAAARRSRRPRCRPRRRRRRPRRHPWWPAAASASTMPRGRRRAARGCPRCRPWPRKASAAWPVSALTQRSTTVTAGRRRPARPPWRRPWPAGRAQVPDAFGQRLLDQAVVVLRDEVVNPAFEEDAQHRVEGVVRLAEVDVRPDRRPVPRAGCGLRPRTSSGLPTASYFHDTVGVTSVSHSHDWPLPPVSR